MAKKEDILNGKDIELEGIIVDNKTSLSENVKEKDTEQEVAPVEESSLIPGDGVKSNDENIVGPVGVDIPNIPEINVNPIIPEVENEAEVQLPIENNPIEINNEPQLFGTAPIEINPSIPSFENVSNNPIEPEIPQFNNNYDMETPNYGVPIENTENKNLFEEAYNDSKEEYKVPTLTTLEDLNTSGEVFMKAVKNAYDSVIKKPTMPIIEFSTQAMELLSEIIRNGYITGAQHDAFRILKEKYEGLVTTQDTINVENNIDNSYNPISDGISLYGDNNYSYNNGGSYGDDQINNGGMGINS